MAMKFTAAGATFTTRTKAPFVIVAGAHPTHPAPGGTAYIVGYAYTAAAAHKRAAKARATHGRTRLVEVVEVVR